MVGCACCAWVSRGRLLRLSSGAWFGFWSVVVLSCLVLSSLSVLSSFCLGLVSSFGLVCFGCGALCLAWALRLRCPPGMAAGWFCFGSVWFAVVVVVVVVAVLLCCSVRCAVVAVSSAPWGWWLVFLLSRFFLPCLPAAAAPPSPASSPPCLAPLSLFVRSECTCSSTCVREAGFFCVGKLVFREEDLVMS